MATHEDVAIHEEVPAACQGTSIMDQGILANYVHFRSTPDNKKSNSDTDVFYFRRRLSTVILS